MRDEEGEEAEGEDGVAEGGAEVLPCGDGGAGIVGRKEQGEHEEEAAGTGLADGDAGEERDADGEFAVGGEEGDGGGVGQDEIAQDRNHEGVGAFLQELVDPELEATVEREGGAENFVAGEDEEEDADADAKKGEGFGVAIDQRRLRGGTRLRGDLILFSGTIGLYLPGAGMTASATGRLSG